MSGQLWSLRVTFALVLVGAFVIAVSATASGQAPSHPCDFDGDGYEELVLGAPGESIGSSGPSAGAVLVISGSADGLDSDRASMITQATPGVPGVAESGDQLGRSVGCGDLDGDGFGDLVVGAPGESIGPRVGAGLFLVVHGSSEGLDPNRSQTWSQASASIAGAAEAGDSLGASLAVCDINGDGFDDVVAAAPGEDVGTRQDAGAINLVLGSSDGLTAADNRVLSADSTGVAGSSEPGDRFGAALACGDIDADGFFDLVVGIPFDRVGAAPEAGRALVLPGSAGGLDTARDWLLSQDDPGVVGAARQGDRFGAALALGDFRGDGRLDLAVGVPGETRGRDSRVGAMHVFTGAHLGSHSGTYWSQATAGVYGAAEPNDRFGEALAVGDFDGDGFDDIAVGVPGESIGPKSGAGQVTVLFGSPSGLAADRMTALHQNSAGMAGVSEAGDRFGWLVAAAELDGDATTDLVVGTPGESLGSLAAAGMGHVLFGSSDGLDPGRSTSVHQGTPGVPGAPEAGDAVAEHPAPCTPGSDPGCDHPLCPIAPGSPTGSLSLVPGSKEARGAGTVVTFSVHVEIGLSVSPSCFAEAVTTILQDPRGWEGSGMVTFSRTDEADADIRIHLASPDTTDALCAPLNTGGIFSCRRGPRVILNAWRWEHGATAFGSDLVKYQQYLVNHEVGHALGQRHRLCPSSGAPAPVMMQQSKGVGACVANGWPTAAEIASLSGVSSSGIDPGDDLE